jgi:hypothetical protein
MKGLFEWLHGLFLSCISFTANALLGIMTIDITFFEKYAPGVIKMYDVFTAAGWALLLGNLVFQAMKAMLAGLGFETESPAALLGRSAIYGFLLLSSRRIFMFGLSIGGQVIDLLGIPGFITIKTPDANFFTRLGIGNAGWIMAIIIGTIIGWQLIKLFFEIGERYVVVCVLILCAPLGFAMGGSKATKDIASGYIRMFGSMVIMMILNVVFLKLVLDVLSSMPIDDTVIPWCILIVALVRTARKVDNIIARIGLNPVITGDPLTGRGGAMALTLLAVRALTKGAAAKAGNAKGSGSTSGRSTGTANTSKGASKPNFGTTNQSSSANNQNQLSNSANNSSSQNANSNQNNTTALGGAGSSNGRFGSQPRNTNNSSSRNSQTANTAGQKSTTNAGANMQNLNSQQKSSASMSSKTNQGGNNASNNQAGAKAPTQINTNRFGNNNAASRNANTANASNNIEATSNAKFGQTNNMANMQKSSQSNNISAPINQSAPKISANVAPTQNTTVNHGKNTTSPAIPARSAQTTVNQGNNPGTAAGQVSSAQTTVNNGRNVVTPADSAKGVQPAVNNGKNTVKPANQVKGVPASANNGKNATVNAQSAALNGKNTQSKPARSVKTPQTAAINGKNAASPTQGNKPQISVPHGKNTLPKTVHPVKMPQPAVINGKNNIKPVDVKTDKVQEMPEEIKNSEVKSDV